jgi:hypothetical protein
MLAGFSPPPPALAAWVSRHRREYRPFERAKFYRRFIYSSDINESTSLSSWTTPRNVLFFLSCPIYDFIIPSKL